ncbi:cytochrome P450 3A19 [Eurytemora carolleeae]|uniref:cytochrome P450 3A19 n=1 Tax=Eurytemora carolleeae TaxID=1294199 RepID=UPI000C7565A6|nr:cytochrome P450 3A19 [Eurytemora carolleeae]|eukprot:XP_023331632.1 cytochrome P450 3A19-like [Eurytemora affinis]
MMMMIMIQGMTWKRARSTLAPTFSAAKMKKMSGIMGTTVDTMIDILRSKIDEAEIIDFNEVYQRLTLDTIGQCALAMNVNCQRDPEDRFLKMVRAALDRQIDTTVIISSCFPAVEKIIAWMFSRRGRKRTNQVIIEKCREVLKARRANPPNPPPVDALQLCMDAAGTDGKLSEDEIVAHEFIFILAGYETTAAALNFTTYLLAKHPEIQSKLQQEIDRKFKKDIKVNYDNVTELEYLDMVLSESMRVYPPIPLHIGRWASQERTICGKTIPQGAGVLAATWILHHHPGFWTDPWKFDPERFSTENRDKIIEMTYMPFGDGPRNCIGRRFALMEAKMALVEVFRQFTVSVCESTPNPLPVRNKGLTLAVVGDKLHLRAERRD